MPRLPYSIELHDSIISELIQTEEYTVFKLSFAYVHNEGKGWSQSAEIVIRHPKENVVCKDLPSRIDDGSLVTVAGPYHNLLILPIQIDGEVIFTLELENGQNIFIQGQGVSVSLLGEPKYIEDLEK